MTVLQSRRLAELPAVGFLALAGAWLSADYFRMGAGPSALTARAVLIAALPLLGVALSALAIVQKSIRRGVMVLVVVTPLLGASVGAVQLWISAPDSVFAPSVLQAAFDGLIAGFIFLAPLLGLFWLSRNIGRARAGSMVDAADRRAPYTALSVAIAVGVPVAAYGSDSAPWLAVPFQMSLAIGVIASAALLVSVALDWLGFQKARAASAGWETLEAHDIDDELAPNASTHDLGVGDEVLGRVGRGNAYRDRERLESRLHGRPSLALSVLRRATFRSSIAFVISCAALAWSFSLDETNGRHAKNFSMMSRAMAPTKPAELPDQLPLTCEAYFAMAGGCAERLTGSARQDVSTDIANVRAEWVSHRDRNGIEVSCDRALRFVLAQPSCVSESRGFAGPERIYFGR